MRKTTCFNFLLISLCYRFDLFIKFSTWRHYASNLLTYSSAKFARRLEKTRHGRDNKLFVWKFPKNEQEEKEAAVQYDTRLPVENPSHQQKPWLAYSIDVNALNFCGFSMIEEKHQIDDGQSASILLAVPCSRDSDCV